MSSTPLTIVIVADHGSITGGQAKVAIESALGLQAAGQRVIFFAAALPVDARLAQAGVEVVCLDQTDLLGNSSRAAAMLQGTWNRAAREALAALLARLPRDRTIVHVHGWARALSPSIAPAIAASGLPALYTVHEYFLFCPNGGFYNYQRNETCPLVPLSAACLATHCDQRNYIRKLWRAARLAMAQRIAHLPDIFSDYICLSQFQQDIVAPFLPKNARVHRVSNPIETPALGQKENPASGDFVFVGRLSPEKGALLFAEAATRVGVTPVFVGDGPLADELRARYPNARLLGWQTPEQTRQAMRAARALVFPSLWYEGQPLSVLEAKSLGAPVIVADACAAREEIGDYVSGQWFKSGDALALARALVVARNDALITRLSHAAYDEYWRDPRTPARHVENLVTIYNDMLERCRQAA
jgi:glycosyltransferase involved in cell wall biosynthesis